MNRVVVTGMGICSPIGNTLPAVREALLEGRSGITHREEWRRIGGLRSLVAGAVGPIEPRQIPRRFRRTMGRMAVLGAIAARDAVGQAGLDEDTLGSGRTGVAMGSTTGSPDALQQMFADYAIRHSIDRTEGTLFMKLMSHTVAANVGAALGVKGRFLSACSACASSTQAIGEGFETIRSGRQDVMICGGAEELHPLTVGVFDVLSAASRNFNDAPGRTPRPFDQDRDGLVISEGAAAVVLEELEHARLRGAKAYAEVLGYAVVCDAAHMTRPSVDGMVRCMQEACDSAEIRPGQVDYVNAHATGTLLGDAAEAEALRMTIPPNVPVRATKGYTGHPLAACGAMEAIFCLLMMEGGFVVPTRNLEKVDPACKGLNHIRQLVRMRPRIVLSSNFAFGGVSASLVLDGSLS